MTRTERLVLPVIAITVVALVAVVLLMGFDEEIASQTPPLPVPEPQPSPQQLVEAHLTALNTCDWEGLVVLYPQGAEVYLPGGRVVKGRRAVGNLMENHCRPRAEGGVQGLEFTVEHQRIVGETVTVQWRAEAEFLAAPYLGADAFITRDGLLYVRMTTFAAEQLPLGPAVDPGES